MQNLLCAFLLLHHVWTSLGRSWSNSLLKSHSPHTYPSCGTAPQVQHPLRVPGAAQWPLEG